MSSKPPDSLRQQLLLWLLVPLIALLIADAWFSNRVAVQTADQAFDRLLLASAEAIADDIDVHEGQLVVDLPYAALQLLESNIQERIFYRVINPEGKTVTGYDDLPLPESRPLPSQEWTPYSARYLGEEIYLVALNKQLYGTGLTAPVIVIVAETGEARHALSTQILLQGVARQTGLIIVAGLLVWFGLHRGLKPLRLLRDSLLARTPNDLRPIDPSAHGADRPAPGQPAAFRGRRIASDEDAAGGDSHADRIRAAPEATRSALVDARGSPRRHRSSLTSHCPAPAAGTVGT